MTLTILIATLIGIFVGMLAGLFYRGYQQFLTTADVTDEVTSPKKTDFSSEGRSTFGLGLWDPHGCLNVLNRCIMSNSKGALDEQPLFLLAEHLKMLAVLGKTRGWATPDQFEQWLEAFLELHHFLHPTSAGVSQVVVLPEEVQALQINTLASALLPMIHQAGKLAEVRVETGRITAMESDEKGNAPAQLVLQVKVKPSSENAKQPSPQNLEAQVVCEAKLLRQNDHVMGMTVL